MNEYQRRTEKKNGIISRIIIWQFAIMNDDIVFVFLLFKET